jgi:hypothetical protein
MSQGIPLERDEAYAALAAFTVQILAVSVPHSAWLTH